MDLTVLKVRVYRSLPTRLQQLAVRVVTPNFSVGVIGLITVDGSQVLLVKPSYRSGWVPPGGFVDRGEEPLEAMSREMQEELGLDVTFEPWHRVAFHSRRQGVAFISVAKLAEQRNVEPRSAEILEARWFPVDDLPPMPLDFFEGMPPEDLEALRRLGASGT
ncbi:MAG: hydrolase [Frankiales bacterium]|nr:hydrolase [Frankiales bacterium]